VIGRYVVVCDLETSKNEAALARVGLWRQKKFSSKNQLEVFGQAGQ
jgi:hypothetical protein